MQGYNGIGPKRLGSPIKNLKKISKQLKNSAKMHAEQADQIDSILEKGSPLQKKDACYHKVKARYDVFPSAYASGAIAKCRKVGAANWGNKGKKKK
tara:strand:- start:2282 stop:2569 length:288 start_codon:yes stop_codon:yes gene_type:complete